MSQVTGSGRVQSAVIAVEQPGDGAKVKQPFVLTGWALDSSTSEVPGIGEIQVFATQMDGRKARVRVGEATLGGERPGVAARWGKQFSRCGYEIEVRGLSIGRHVLAMYGRSSSTRRLAVMQAITVDVEPNVELWIDSPAPEEVVGQPFNVWGWAADLGAAEGTGVEAVRIAAYPGATRNSGLVLGEIREFSARLDVAQHKGQQFLASGYGMEVRELRPGVYILEVQARFPLAGIYKQTRTITVVS